MWSRIGLHASHELYPPSQLLRFIRYAAKVGFRAASCSDHFHPWSEQQAQSGFAWSWLGSALEATTLPFGVVCAPGQRYHPAIIAQAVSTLLEMYPGRFWIAVGSGEALNESITGEPWPAKPQRNERLRECVDIMRALWRGDTVTRRGLVKVQNATLYTRPAEPPLVIGAAMSPETAGWMGSWADGLITAGSKHDDVRKIIEAFCEAGGDGKPILLQAAVSYGANDRDAERAAYRHWRHSALELSQLADLPSPRAFDVASAYATPEDVASGLRCSADIKRHIEWIQGDFELGLTSVYVHNVGGNMEQFIDVFSEHILPVFQTS
jgi:probable non-F420 flavinoid oxidoreductase